MKVTNLLVQQPPHKLSYFMTLRAFTSQHKLQDTEEQYAKAVYRFRDAEQKQSLSYTAAKCEMNRLEADLFRLRNLIDA